MAVLGTKSYLSAGMALTAPIISSSMRLSWESKALAGVAMVPGAGPLALPPICADAAIEQRPMTHKTAIRRTCMDKFSSESAFRLTDQAGKFPAKYRSNSHAQRLIEERHLIRRGLLELLDPLQ